MNLLKEDLVTLPHVGPIPSKAEIELGWKAELNLDKMMEDTWRWQNQNPNGYDD